MVTTIQSVCLTLILASIWTTREVLPSHIPAAANAGQSDLPEINQNQLKKTQSLLYPLRDTSGLMSNASNSAADPWQTPPNPFLDQQLCPSTPGVSLFKPRWEGSGMHVESVAHTYDMTGFGELVEEHPDAHRLVAACGNLFMAHHVAGYQPSHVCALEVWGNSFEELHPEIRCKLREYPPSGLRKFAFFLRIFHVAKTTESTSKAVIPSFAWIIVRRIGREMQQQARRGEDPNLGRALTEILRRDKGLIEPFLDMVLLGSGVLCEAKIPYYSRPDDGFPSYSKDFSNWPENPLLEWLASHPRNPVAMVPPRLPRKISVTVSPTLPASEQSDMWRRPLYNLWHLLWWMIFEATRLDLLWGWLKCTDTKHFFPGWEVKAVGVNKVTERRSAAYADGSWRFANINPESLELARDADGLYKDPFQIRPFSRTKQVTKDEKKAMYDVSEVGSWFQGMIQMLQPTWMFWRRSGDGQSVSHGGNVLDLPDEDTVNSSGTAAEVDNRSFFAEVAPTFKTGSEMDKSQSPIPGAFGEEGPRNSFSVEMYSPGPFSEDSDASASQQNRYYSSLNNTVDVTDYGTFVEYKKGTETLHIYKGRCGAPPTFAFPRWSPFAVLLEPTLSTRSAAKLEGVSLDGWMVPDAVWAFRPTSSQKLWLFSRLVTPLLHEPLLSDDPNALMHNGYHYLFQKAIKPLIMDMIDAITTPERKNGIESSTLNGHTGTTTQEKYRNNTSQSSLENSYGEQRRFFQQRSKRSPYCIVFTGYSLGGATAAIAGLFFLRELKRRKLDNHVRVMVVSFGSLSWGTPAMYKSFESLGIIHNEIWASHDPVPAALSGPDVLGLATDRDGIMLYAGDLGNIKFHSPFKYNGKRWLMGSRYLGVSGQILAWLLSVENTLALPHNPRVSHQHTYPAALSVLTGSYQYIGWMSHLAVPWVPPSKLSPFLLPEDMKTLQDVHQDRFPASK